MSKTQDVILLFISILLFSSTFIFFVDNNYIITAIFAVFLIIQCYFGNINIWISILLGVLVSIYESIVFYFTEDVIIGNSAPWKFKNIDIELTQQPIWDILGYSIFNNMFLLIYRIFNTSSKFNLTYYNFSYTITVGFISLIFMLYFNYNHNLLAILTLLIALLLYCKIKVDLICILATLIIFPIMEHTYISLSQIYVPVKTPGEIFIGQEPLYWLSFYISWIMIIPFLYYFLNKLNIFN